MSKENNEKLVADITEMLKNLADNRQGMFKTSIPEKEINNALQCVYATTNRITRNLMNKYSDSMVLCPEYEKELDNAEG